MIIRQLSDIGNWAQTKSFFNWVIYCHTLQAVLMERASSFKTLTKVWLMEWHFDVSTFRMHHSMHAFVVNYQTNSKTSSQCNVAHWLSYLFSIKNWLFILKQCTNVYISIDKDIFFSFREAKCIFKKLVNRKVLPCQFRCSCNAAKFRRRLVQTDRSKSSNAKCCWNYCKTWFFFSEMIKNPRFYFFKSCHWVFMTCIKPLIMDSLKNLRSFFLFKLEYCCLAGCSTHLNTNM